MRAIVISDIHGMYDLFLKTLENVKYAPIEDRLILLGDYVDRGEHSCEVIEEVMRLQKEGNVIALLGNHEDMLIKASTLKGEERLWYMNGGMTTQKSYEKKRVDIDSHLSWYQQLPKACESDNYFFCHAGVNPHFPFDKQSAGDLLWIREEFYDSNIKLPKTVVFGHTPQRAGYRRFFNGALGIDGGAVFTGNMTALVLEDGTETIFMNTMRDFSKIAISQ